MNICGWTSDPQTSRIISLPKYKAPNWPSYARNGRNYMTNNGTKISVKNGQVAMPQVYIQFGSSPVREYQKVGINQYGIYNPPNIPPMPISHPSLNLPVYPSPQVHNPNQNPQNNGLNNNNMKNYNNIPQYQQQLPQNQQYGRIFGSQQNNFNPNYIMNANMNNSVDFKDNLRMSTGRVRKNSIIQKVSEQDRDDIYQSKINTGNRNKYRNKDMTRSAHSTQPKSSYSLTQKRNHTQTQQAKPHPFNHNSNYNNNQFAYNSNVSGYRGVGESSSGYVPVSPTSNYNSNYNYNYNYNYNSNYNNNANNHNNNPQSSPTQPSLWNQSFTQTYAKLVQQNAKLRKIIEQEYYPLKAMYEKLKEQHSDREYLVSQLQWKVKELAKDIQKKRN